MVASARVAVLILAGALAGCGATGPDAPDLSRACQLTPCSCEDPRAAFWQEPNTVPIEWKRSGEATCPEGYVLRKAKKKGK
jgi:hypothetical protein